MALQSSSLEYYDKMQELEERLKRSEEERMILQRQFDLLLQENHEKERARVSAVEARYKRFLDEDKRRRDRNSSLLQTLDRIDSHTASLAAKTERMRALRKHYEAFIAHSYPGWHMGIMDRSYCPLAPLPPAPNVMTRVSEITGYDTETQRCLPDPNDYSETQYHTLPSVTGKSFYPLASPLCRSDLSIVSREDCPEAGRSLYRSGSASVRSASLSPSRVRDLSNQYDSEKRASSSLRHYDQYPSSKSPDIGLSPRLKNALNYSSKSDLVKSPRSAHFYPGGMQAYGEEKHNPYRPFSSTNNHFLDSDHGHSDFEIDQNTSGDLLNLSNLSLSDDGILNEPDSPPPYSGASQQQYGTTRDSYLHSKNPSISLPLSHASLRHQISPRDAFIPKRSGGLSPRIFTEPSPKSILSPRGIKTDVASSIPVSDSVQRILLPTDDFNTKRYDVSLSPRRQTPTWQTLRPSYLQPQRSSIRRSVTFTEPEFESPYAFQTEDVGLYNGSYGSLRKHSPSLPTSTWESSDHERFLREKQGREKDAFREKIERLKELIQENKDQEMGLTAPVLDSSGKGSSTRPKSNGSFQDYDEHKKNSPLKESSSAKDWKVSQSRRPSFAMDLSSDSSEQLLQSEQEHQIDRQNNEDLDLKVKTHFRDDETISDSISDKEHWSGQFSEKDEDMREKVEKVDEKQDLELEQRKNQDLNDTKHTNKENKMADYEHFVADQSSEEHYSQRTKEASDPIQEGGDSLSKNLINNIDNEPEQQKQLEQLDSLSDKYQHDLQIKEEENANFTLMETQVSPQQVADFPKGEETLPKQGLDLDFKLEESHSQDQDNQKQYKQPPQEEQKNFADYANAYDYDEGRQQRSEWLENDENKMVAPQQNVSYSYEQSGKQPSGDFENQQLEGTQGVQGSGYEPYPKENENDQSSFENQQSNFEQQPQVQENYGDKLGYESYQEPQLAPSSTSGHQDFSEDPNQYQQNYQTYSEDQQYGEQQDQNFVAQEQNNYQYSQDPSKPQYEYEGQDYNYQQNQDTYGYTQDPNYQQDSGYQPDQSYQQGQPDQSYQQGQPDQSYQQGQPYQQDQSYQPDQSYQGDQPFEQDQTYQQDRFQEDPLFQETEYKGPQQYEGYQAAVDDLSEDTTPSADSNYQTQYQPVEAADQQQTLEQYRALLGADPGSEPAYSDSSEIENQMAAVVGQGGNTTPRLAEPSQPTQPLPSTSPSQPSPVTSQPSPAASPSTAASASPSTAASASPSTAASPSPTPAKGKAGAKKRPQLTRKQSSITPDSANGRQQSSSNLPKMAES